MSLDQGELHQQPFREGEGHIDAELVKKVNDILGSYCTIILRDTSELERGSLADTSVALAEQHLGELETLQDLFEQFSENPGSFDMRVQTADYNGGVFNAKLGLKSDTPFGDGIENARTQLNFYLQLAQGQEAIDDTIYAESRVNDPHKALINTQYLHAGKFHLNTNQVFRDPRTRDVKVIPQAGIQFLRDNEGTITQRGIKYIGTAPHFAEIPSREKVTNSQLDTLQNLTRRLATERK